MNPTLHQAVSDTFVFLMTLDREGIRPPEAQVRLLDLQARHPETTMHLVWEEEACDASVHYDVLLRLPEGATLSLSFCPDRALPWPLRGVHRWSDADLLRVNGVTLKVQQAIACLDFIWGEAPILNRLVNTIVMREELGKDPIKLTDAELQLGIDGFRRAHKLYSAEDTQAWIQTRGMTHTDLEQLVGDVLVAARLRDRLVEGRIQSYFEDHRADFDTVHIVQIESPDHESVHQIYRQILAGEVTFLEAAQQHFLSSTTKHAETQRPLFATVQRREASTEFAVALFAAAPGDVVGPTPTDSGYAIAHVLSRGTASLGEPTRTTIKEILWETWLTEHRQAARIEWFWG
ncbi:MAG TPA: TIGR04500 family putative peptide maturation system protein [Candidatus Tectomicrobia bacterium]